MGFAIAVSLRLKDDLVDSLTATNGSIQHFFQASQLIPFSKQHEAVPPFHQNCSLLHQQKKYDLTHRTGSNSKCPDPNQILH